MDNRADEVPGVAVAVAVSLVISMAFMFLTAAATTYNEKNALHEIACRYSAHPDIRHCQEFHKTSSGVYYKRLMDGYEGVKSAQEGCKP